MSLDAKDNSILKLLILNPRMPYSHIADILGISRPTVKKRIKRMLADESIIISAKKNLKNQSGKVAILGLEVKSEEHWDECIKKINTLPWVQMGLRSIGKSNLHVVIYGENDEILERNINDFRYFHCVNFIEVKVLGKPILGLM